MDDDFMDIFDDEQKITYKSLYTVNYPRLWRNW